MIVIFWVGAAMICLGIMITAIGLWTWFSGLRASAAQVPAKAAAPKVKVT